jgi:hypothetical protein
MLVSCQAPTVLIFFELSFVIKVACQHMLVYYSLTREQTKWHVN